MLYATKVIFNTKLYTVKTTRIIKSTKSLREKKLTTFEVLDEKNGNIG